MKKLSIFILFYVCISLCTAQEARPMVTNITVSSVLKDGQVTINWFVSQEAANQIQELLVYKVSGSIIKPVTLSSTQPIASLPALTTQYTDVLSDYKEYYYAIVAIDTKGNLYDVLIPTVNTTDSPVIRARIATPVVKAEVIQQQEVVSPRPQANISSPQRERPLPVLQINEEIEKNDVPIITEQTLLNTNSFHNITQNSSYFTSEILPVDQNGQNATGDDYTIFYIVDTYISKGDWKTAEAELEKFLQTNRSKTTTARANFYLAQAKYFNQDYRTSLFFFQQAKKVYPLQSNKWIEEVLNRYTVQ